MVNDWSTCKTREQATESENRPRNLTWDQHSSVVCCSHDTQWLWLKCFKKRRAHELSVHWRELHCSHIARIFFSLLQTLCFSQMKSVHCYFAGQSAEWPRDVCAQKHKETQQLLLSVCFVADQRCPSHWLCSWLCRSSLLLNCFVAEPDVKVNGRFYRDVLQKRRTAVMRRIIPGQRTCSPRSRYCSAIAARDTRVHRTRPVPAKQPGLEPVSYCNLGGGGAMQLVQGHKI